jgi:flagellar biosynthesis/type III secretory pathway protein FliH
MQALSRVVRSQRSPQRHKCAACAYEQGRRDGYAEGLAEARALIVQAQARLGGLAARGSLRLENSDGSPQHDGPCANQP